VPQIVPLQGVPAAIPEVPLAKRLDQRGVAKISMFAYHRESGRPVWQSGLASRESSSNDVWLFGAGPFQYGSVLHQHPDAQVSRSGDVTTERDAEPHKDGAKGKSWRSKLADCPRPKLSPPRNQKKSLTPPRCRPENPNFLLRRPPRNLWWPTHRFPSRPTSTRPAVSSRGSLVRSPVPSS
jgi:hypothetical protein